jgi:hypothetical protein
LVSSISATPNIELQKFTWPLGIGHEPRPVSPGIATQSRSRDRRCLFAAREEAGPLHVLDGKAEGSCNAIEIVIGVGKR